MSTNEGEASPLFLQGGGKMGESIRLHDWVNTLLGDLAQWSGHIALAVDPDCAP